MFSHIDIEILCSIGLVVIGWWDLRNKREKEHQENRDRLTRIETMVEPIAEWFNHYRGEN